MIQEDIKHAASLEAIAGQLERLRDSFAKRPDGFYVSLAEMLGRLEYSERRITGAVDDVMRTVSYNGLSISEVVQACERQPEDTYRWEISLIGETRVSTYSQFKADCHRFGSENVKLIERL